MLNSFGTIDQSLELKQLDVFLAKPHADVTKIGKTIGKLNNFINNPTHTVNLGNLNEIEFRVPYNVENKIEHELVKNPYVDKLLERFLLKVKIENEYEWYIINEIKDNMSDNSDMKTVHAFSLGYELADELIRDYNVVSYSLWQVSNETVQDTLWTIGDIDPIFEDKFRSFEVPEATALDFLFQIRDTFGASIEFDTIYRKIHFRDPNKGKKQPLTIGYGKYLKTLGKSSNSDEMVTRLYVYGKDGLSINRVNPAGASYLEDFSYFLFPFERDDNRNVIKSSRYMSDSLCHAILDYNELLESKEGVFASLLEQQEEVQANLTQRKNELFQLETDLKIIQSTLDVQRAHGTFFYRDNTYSNKSDTIGFGLTNTSYNVVMLKVYNSTLSVNIDGNVINPPKLNEWFVARKITDKELTYVNTNGTGRIEIIIVEISLDEYNSSDNSIILDRYNEFIKQKSVDDKNAEIEAIENELNEIDTQISEFQEEISIENNFTPQQIAERKRYIIKRTWSDENYFEDRELLEAAKSKFLEYKMPKTIINLDIVNFLQVLSEQRNWDKLGIGDEIRIRYDKINVDIRAKITQIVINYDDQTIKLTIANIKDLFGEYARILEYMKTTNRISTSLDSSKWKWNDAVEKATYANDKLNQAYRSSEQRILAGVDEQIEISHRGLVARSPSFPNEMLILQAGVLALSRSSGLNWETAITPYGCVTEKIKYEVILLESE